MEFKLESERNAMAADFRNNDSVLLSRVETVVLERKRLGLEGLVGGLETVILGVEPDRLKDSAGEFLGTTGYLFGTALDSPDGPACVLALPGSADFLLHARAGGPTPFDAEPKGPKSAHLPHTRVETMVFLCHDL